jgi:cbb3-type cytochrome oxidase maturation protein
MNIVILLILSSVIAASIFLIAFLWAAKSGQYDDVHTPAVRMLFEDTIIERVTSSIDKDAFSASSIEINSNTEHGTRTI